MLEGVVARVLNSLLGKYVQEFDAEGLNVGIFSGNVTLRDLKLKPSCLVRDTPLPKKIFWPNSWYPPAGKSPLLYFGLDEEETMKKFRIDEVAPAR